MYKISVTEVVNFLIVSLVVLIIGVKLSIQTLKCFLVHFVCGIL